MSGAWERPALKNENLRLEKVDVYNFDELYDLAVTLPQQAFVATNRYSMAEAYATISSGRFVQAFGIYDGDMAVGFAMIGHRSENYEGMPEARKNGYTLWRLMIDQRFQQLGYGRDALALLLSYVLSAPDGEEDTWTVSCEETNEAAWKLFRSFGFVPNGETDGEETVLVYKL